MDFLLSLSTRSLSPTCPCCREGPSMPSETIDMKHVKVETVISTTPSSDPSTDVIITPTHSDTSELHLDGQGYAVACTTLEEPVERTHEDVVH